MDILFRFLFVLLAFGITLSAFIYCVFILFFRFTDQTNSKRVRHIIRTILAATLSFVIYQQYFYTFEKIDRDPLIRAIGPIVSEGQNYAAEAYYEPDASTPNHKNIWIEIENKQTKERKVVYYGSAKNYVQLSWLENGKLAVFNANDPTAKNQFIELDVENEIYDESGLACKSIIVRKDIEHCFKGE